MSLDYLTLSELEYQYDDFDRMYDRDEDDLQSLHMEYIMEHCGGDRMICDGDMLIEAQEEGYLYEDFREYYMEYIMEHCGGDRMICDGDMLIEAQEEGYLYEDFREYYMEDIRGHAY